MRGRRGKRGEGRKRGSEREETKEKNEIYWEKSVTRISAIKKIHIYHCNDGREDTNLVVNVIRG